MDAYGMVPSPGRHPGQIVSSMSVPVCPLRSPERQGVVGAPLEPPRMRSQSPSFLVPLLNTVGCVRVAEGLPNRHRLAGAGTVSMGSISPGGTTPHVRTLGTVAAASQAQLRPLPSLPRPYGTSRSPSAQPRVVATSFRVCSTSRSPSPGAQLQLAPASIRVCSTSRSPSPGAHGLTLPMTSLSTTRATTSTSGFALGQSASLSTSSFTTSGPPLKKCVSSRVSQLDTGPLSASPRSSGPSRPVRSPIASVSSFQAPVLPTTLRNVPSSRRIVGPPLSPKSAAVSQRSRQFADGGGLPERARSPTLEVAKTLHGSDEEQRGSIEEPRCNRDSVDVSGALVQVRTLANGSLSAAHLAPPTAAAEPESLGGPHSLRLNNPSNGRQQRDLVRVESLLGTIQAALHGARTMIDSIGTGADDGLSGSGRQSGWKESSATCSSRGQSTPAFTASPEVSPAVSPEMRSTRSCAVESADTKVKVARWRSYTMAPREEDGFCGSTDVSEQPLSPSVLSRRPPPYGCDDGSSTEQACIEVVADSRNERPRRRSEAGVEQECDRENNSSILFRRLDRLQAKLHEVTKEVAEVQTVARILACRGEDTPCPTPSTRGRTCTKEESPAPSGESRLCGSMLSATWQPSCATPPESSSMPSDRGDLASSGGVDNLRRRGVGHGHDVPLLRMPPRGGASAVRALGQSAVNVGLNIGKEVDKVDAATFREAQRSQSSKALNDLTMGSASTEAARAHNEAAGILALLNDTVTVHSGSENDLRGRCFRFSRPRSPLQ
eukprot:TRINITY_DN14152_c0_g1_i2.p1 TRINITY_DN14152_c0_g1~~TRINITY_DN14152_c0_g1_i2.p1  ORF type:complete len:777 (-),score=113.90 TRINITY_DN14152_c0_g1_i2:336-2666(-)